MSYSKQPVVFISHGGGPWPYMPEVKKQYVKTTEWLTTYFQSLPKTPTAIICISAHWEENHFAVSAASDPEMIYDYGGFPEHTYQVQYPAKGHPVLAKQIFEQLNQASLPTRLDLNRGFDHGTFVPLSLMYPAANIPVVSLSIHSSYDVQLHWQLGQALQKFRSENILIVGSGLSYHNMRGFGTNAGLQASVQFGNWLNEVVQDSNSNSDSNLKSNKYSNINSDQALDVNSLALNRKNKILNWEQAPSARAAHPYEDHLIPLISVIAAAGDDSGHVAYVDRVMNVDMASYYFD